jgi:hypothetical protein
MKDISPRIIYRLGHICHCVTIVFITLVIVSMYVLGRVYIVQKYVVTQKKHFMTDNLYITENTTVVLKPR